MRDFSWETVGVGLAGPGPRSRHGLTYDRAAKAAVLFGGIVWTKGGQLKSDTWELRDGHWLSVTSQTRPPARHRGAMIFDERRGISLLFGGQASSGALLGDTWVYAQGQRALTGRPGRL
jgi:hypothetical protein